MSKVKLTAGRIEDFACEKGKPQSFLWCTEVPGLGVRATAGSDEKRYIFQAKVNKQTMRKTIGSVKAWSIPTAQAEARRLQVLIDTGHDPRVVESNLKKETERQLKEEKEQEQAAIEKEKRESVTFESAWNEYINDRKKLWSSWNLHDHTRMMHIGGEIYSRNKQKKTQPGILRAFAKMRLIDITKDTIIGWAKNESPTRPTHARLALRLLKAFFNWCSEHADYKIIIIENPAKNKRAFEHLGTPKAKSDVLQREQLKNWFDAVKKINNPIISSYLQILLLTGARREELASLCWDDVDFKWNSITIHDKIEDERIIPLTPYVSYLLSNLPRRNAWVFSSKTSASQRLTDPRRAHENACKTAELNLTLHGLRRSFASLCEWIETPAGIAAQIQGHKPQGVREKNYIRRPLDLLRMWHIKIEAWMLEQAEIEFTPEQSGLRLVKSALGA